jgi:hypothetical protein
MELRIPCLQSCIARLDHPASSCPMMWVTF